ncbi:MAG: cell division FtsA domain-containing protein [Bacillota bacterium]|nr:cell division FtsA domain-containing protein [Bacillota bacterium]
MIKTNSLPGKYVFSLDIGTRNVVGMIGKLENDIYSIVDYEMISHPERAMFDGQIHDINRVVKVVKEIVLKLEKRNELKLNEVVIAAAGRALKTKEVTIERQIDNSILINKELIDNIEMEGIQQSQDELDKELDIKTRYYCVGYSSKMYYLDGSMIKSPIDHRGLNLKVDIIATFLPHIVVDSLYTVIDKAGLEVASLTLEPIAAINVAIPDKLRALNLALVDIGAGTSDIAITKAGSIISYGMVAKAGDSITEMLVQEFLLDFDIAEKLKMDLLTNDEIVFVDIVGIEHKYTKTEILEVLDEILEDLSEKISKEIINKNGKKPSAVFCIGGGCQVPGFTEKLANKLDIQNERVIVKGVEMIENLDFNNHSLIGPEYITPIGIGYNGIVEKEKDFLQVSVNGKNIRIFNSKKLSVSHALILVGYDARRLLAQRGKKIIITIDDEKKYIYGDYGESAKIYINGVLSSLDTKIKNKDSIYVEEATVSESKRMKVYSYLDLSKTIKLNGDDFKLIKSFRVNNEVVNSDYILKDNDEIKLNKLNTLQDLCNSAKIDITKYYFVIKDSRIEKDYILKANDNIQMHEIEYIEKTESESEVSNVIEMNKIKKNKTETETYYFIVNGETVAVKKTKTMVFVDIFEHIDFDLRTAKGIIDLRLNGERAKYTEVLNDGDIIDIKWR